MKKAEKVLLIFILAASCVATAAINVAIFAVETYIDIPAEYVSVKSTDAAPGYGAENVLDGDSATMWHTSWVPAPVPMPQSLIFEFTEIIKLSEICVLPRQDMENGRITRFNIYLKKPGGSFEIITDGGEWGYTDNIDYKSAAIDPPTEAVSVKLEVLEGQNGFASAAEVMFRGVVTGRASAAYTEPDQPRADIPFSHVGSLGIYADDEHPLYPGIHVLDDDPATIWHTDWENGDRMFPHRLYIDLGGEYTVTGLRFLDRQDGSQNGNIIKCALYSDTGQKTAEAEPRYTGTGQFREIALNGPIKTTVLIIEITEAYGEFASMASLSVLTEEAGVITSCNAFD